MCSPDGVITCRSRSFQLSHIRLIWTEPLFAPSLSSLFSSAVAPFSDISASCTPAPIASEPSPSEPDTVGVPERSLPLPLLLLDVDPARTSSGTFLLVEGSIVLLFCERKIRNKPLNVAIRIRPMTTRDTASATRPNLSSDFS